MTAVATSSGSAIATSSAQRLTLVATILGSSIVILDSSVVNVALPSIQRSLGGGLAGQQWVTNAYLLMLGSLILLGGSLGDIFGEFPGSGVWEYDLTLGWFQLNSVDTTFLATA